MNKSKARIFIILYLLFTILTCELVAQPKEIKFKHLTINDGLSQNGVNTIYQDSRNFMWFGTKSGLNKFDGYDFTIYKHDPLDSGSISNSTITSIHENDNNNLLIGTYGGGLNIYNRNKDHFINYQHDPDDSTSINGNFVECIFEDSQGNIWVGTTFGLNLFNEDNGSFISYVFHKDDSDHLENNRVTDILEGNNGKLWIATQFHGLVHFEPDKETMKFYKHNPDNPNSIANNYIWTLYEDSNGDCWVGTYGQGLDLFNRETKTFTHYKDEVEHLGNLSNNHIISIFEDSGNRLWVGSDGGGLSIFDRENGTFTRFKHHDDQPYSIGDNVILSIYEDNSGTLWVGTLFGGVNYNYDIKFKHYKKDGSKNSLSHNVLAQIYGDSRGLIWIGTDHGGLNQYNPETNTFKQFVYNPEKPGGISNNVILAITEDKENNMWFGTYGGGINVYDYDTKTFRYYKHDPNDPKSLASDYIGAILTDSNGNIWVGVPPIGLNLYNPDKDDFTHFQNIKEDPSSLSGTIVVELCEDSKGQMWVGTSLHGLNVVDIEDAQNKEELNFRRYKHDPNDPNSLSNNQIRVIFESSKGQIWIGTNGGGLNLFHPETSSFTCYTEHDGLPSNVIQSMLEDDHGNLWISTNRGLSRFNVDDEKFHNYDISDGLQSYEFGRFSSSYKSKDGKMYFGGVNGFNVFHPDSLDENTVIPPVVITNFKIFNEPATIGKHGPLQKHITEANEIVLDYDQTVISFEYAALNYTAPEKNEYAYKLVGFDKDWNYVGTSRTATYTNLDPGTYTFRVKASNNDGRWNKKGTSIQVTILPPWWETWWFKFIVAFSIMTIIFGVYKLRVHNMEAQKRELEKQVNEKTTELKATNRALTTQSHNLAKKNQELDQFAYIVSHDLKAPLRGIKNLSDWIEEDLKEGNDAEIEENIHTLKGRVDRMKNLIDGILDYSRVGRSEINYTSVNTNKLMNDVINMLEIPNHFTIHLPNYLPIVQASETWMEQVFSNLVSNAIKYHDKPNGNIFIGYREQKTKHEFSVADDGPGIPDDAKTKIFGMFQTLQSRDTIESTGVGLAIVKKIIEEQGGEIWVESMPEGGSKFIFTLPKG